MRAHRRRTSPLRPILGCLALLAVLSVPGTAAAAHRWVPQPTDTFQYQLSGAIDVTVGAKVFDLDALETPRSVIAQLHHRGRRAICYVDAGTWESYRPDADSYPADMLGKPVDGWPDERWVDIRQLATLEPIIRARVDRCAATGFDGVEYDWMDSYDQATGFPISRADSLRFDRWLASLAHARGLSVGLKNSGGLVTALVGRFDFAVTEECFQYHECGLYRPFLDAGKAVFDVEYRLGRDSFCAHARDMGISASRKHLSLSAWRRAC